MNGGSEEAIIMAFNQVRPELMTQRAVVGHRFLVPQPDTSQSYAVSKTVLFQIFKNVPRFLEMGWQIFFSNNEKGHRDKSQCVARCACLPPNFRRYHIIQPGHHANIYSQCKQLCHALCTMVLMGDITWKKWKSDWIHLSRKHKLSCNVEITPLRTTSATRHSVHKLYSDAVLKTFLCP